MLRKQARVSQVIVLSYSKPFLWQLWEGADTAARQAMLIRRGGLGSILAVWGVNQDCITEHDRRHAFVRAIGTAQASRTAAILRGTTLQSFTTPMRTSVRFTASIRKAVVGAPVAVTSAAKTHLASALHSDH